MNRILHIGKDKEQERRIIMIDFKDIRFTDKEELIFLPAALLNDFLYFLDCKRPDVKHKTFMLFKIFLRARER